MGERKNHHYVPRFYLKRFSHNNEGKLVGLYNHVNSIFIQKAPIKHQASKDYLYGDDDEIEIQLSILEGSISKLFYYWTEEKILIPPPQNSNGYKVLKRFILYQIFRTPKAGDYVNEITNNAFQIIIEKYYPDLFEKTKGGKLVNSEPVLLALSNSVDKEHLLNFLSCKFLVNLSDIPFVTSDAPVVLYNQLMENFGVYAGATAITAKGLQIFYPIHPRLMICLYDTEEYIFGNQNEDCSSTESIKDIHQLNGLQYINSHSQIFFNEFIEKEYAHQIIENYKHKRTDSRSINKFIKTPDNRNILYSSFEDSKIGLNLSFFSFSKKSNRNYNSFVLRHESLKK